MSTNILSFPTTSSRRDGSTTSIIPLDSPVRQVPIHASLPDIRVPGGDLKPYQFHPVTCDPLTAEHLSQYKLYALEKQYTTVEAALKAQEEAVKELRTRMEEMEQKTREIDREMEEMEKMREVERKVYQKQGKGVANIT